MQDYQQKPAPTRKPSPRRKKNRVPDILLFLFLLLFPTVCASTFGFVLFRAGYIPAVVSSNLTATAIAKKNASCQALIEKAMQVSNSFCNQIGSNKVCYGNNTIQADLAPESTQKFSERGDIVDVNQLRRISASPLKLDSAEWGIAFFKIIANLPRSLPGQTVTMVVFGNTTLDNASGNLESFFFSSELGQISCDKVPNDGIMLSVPDGEGVKFTVNGAELTLTGDASIKAVKNGKMEVNLFEGSGRIVSGGDEQYFGAGQQVNVQLGGENGTESIGSPSKPIPLSQEDLDTACAMTGQFCSQDQIILVSSELAQEELGTQTATNPVTSTITRTPTGMPTATSTILVIPSWTPSRMPSTPTRAATPVVVDTPVKTPTPRRTTTPRNTTAPTNTLPVFTQVPSSTPANTETLIPANTATSTPILTLAPTSTATSTPIPTLAPTNTTTSTPIPTATNTAIDKFVCSSSQIIAGMLTENGNSLVLNLTNNSGGVVTIDAMRIVWNVGVATKILDQFLDGKQIGNANEQTSPSNFPDPNPFTGNDSLRDIEIVGTNTEILVINFQAPPTGGGYLVQLHFNIGCQIEASK